MKKLINVLFVASFAAFPLFASQEEVVIEEPNRDEVTIDEIKEAQEVPAEEITVLEDQKEEVVE